MSDNEFVAMLMDAVCNGHLAIAEFCLRHIAEVDQTDASGYTAFYYAAMHDHVDILKMLLEHGAQIDNVVHSSQTALMTATRLNCIDAVAFLVDHRADVNRVSVIGWSSLMYAAHRGCVDVARILLARDDVDTALCDESGIDCLDLAEDENHHEIAQLIVQHRTCAEKQRLVNIGLGFAAKQLPVHLLVNIYEQTIVFEDQRVSLFDCWEILKVPRQRKNERTARRSARLRQKSSKQ